MKRLLIAAFLVITSVTIFAVNHNPAKNTDCIRKNEICCKKPCKTAPSAERADYIFWEPIGRLMFIQP